MEPYLNTFLILRFRSAFATLSLRFRSAFAPLSQDLNTVKIGGAPCTVLTSTIETITCR